ncbi:TrkH family potassium uptake protein [Bartonella sp. HY329]|uniref:TrkH family potassium uptake protein n=1 Tax=unclassified Bartonella TaxID=2645622 RepID=UPI0021C8463F|nr:MULTISPECIES: TrkH family potassium uptake protein [unclassified Bartonella]UXM94940.1 TrkH family potassium uptake protein [Bartonella sp. HY329]UXN09263.1 TrkH family potassium uptake protein [Bartonella sp. HY328]
MAAAMLLPALADIRQGNDDWQVFIYASLLTFMVATLVLVSTHGATARFSTRLGFLLTASLWVTACFLGALPIFFSHLPISFAQAIFESVSGVTTTGATVLADLDVKPAGILLWRSLLCWIGGIGFIGLALLLLPSLRVGGVQLFHMESSDRSEKILPRVNQIANAIIIAYLSLTVLCTLCYFAAGMNMFDALNHSMTTVATAGFSTHDDSLGFYADQPMIIVIATIFMLASAMPFVFYVKMVIGHSKQRFYDPQVKLFLSIVAIASFVLALSLSVTRDEAFGEAFLTALFHFVSVITTTGYATEDYANWGPLALGIFFLASLIGGCSGSTSGGIKINRIIILWRLTAANLARLLSPNVVVKVRYGGSEVSGDIAQTVLLFLCLYMTTLILGAMLLVITGLDFVSAISGALTALSNVGPGFGDKIGPVGNFSTIEDNSLWILSFLMLAGRLEIVTIFILFIPAFWQR